MAQLYEDYWKITLEYSDINSDRFIGTLRIIVDFVNKNKKKIIHQNYLTHYNKKYTQVTLKKIWLLFVKA